MISDFTRQTFDMICMGLLNKDNSLSNPLSRKDQPWSGAMLRISLCLFLFWVTFYFTSMVRTELVSVKNPVTINSYQDILQENLMPVFIESTTDYLSFMHASKDSDAGKIWTRVKSQAGGYRDSLKKGNEFSSQLDAIFRRKKVLIASRERSYVVRTLCCKTKTVLDNLKITNWQSLRSWMRGDSSAAAVIRGFVFNAGFRDQSVRHRLLALFENGFENHVFTTVELDILTSKTLRKVLADNVPLDEKHECLGDTVEKSLPTVNQPKIVNFKKLFLFEFALGLITAFGSLIFELGVIKAYSIVQQSQLKKRQLTTISLQKITLEQE